MDLPYLQVLLFVPQDLVVLRDPVEKQSRTFQLFKCEARFSCDLYYLQTYNNKQTKGPKKKQKKRNEVTYSYLIIETGWDNSRKHEMRSVLALVKYAVPQYIILYM